MSGQRPRSISLAAASDYFFVLVDFRKAKIKREFRALRSASQGSALRTRKPFEKGLSESFNFGCVSRTFCPANYPVSRVPDRLR